MNAPNFDVAAVRRLQQSGQLQIAAAIARKVARAAQRLSADTVTAIALQRYPDVAPTAALDRLSADVDDFVGLVDEAGCELRAALSAERERIAPIVVAAATRNLQIGSEVSAIEARVASIQSRDATKRERLRSAGLGDDDLQAVAAPTNTSDLLARRAALVAESDALERFLSTRDESDLPATFSEGAAA